MPHAVCTSIAPWNRRLLRRQSFRLARASRRLESLPPAAVRPGRLATVEPSRGIARLPRLRPHSHAERGSRAHGGALFARHARRSRKSGIRAHARHSSETAPRAEPTGIIASRPPAPVHSADAVAGCRIAGERSARAAIAESKPCRPVSRSCGAALPEAARPRPSHRLPRNGEALKRIACLADAALASDARNGILGPQGARGRQCKRRRTDGARPGKGREAVLGRSDKPPSTVCRARVALQPPVAPPAGELLERGDRSAGCIARVEGDIA